MPGRRSALMTEYRRSYQPSQFRCAATTYFSNREFRLQQLQRFQNHSADPFVWPDDDDDDDDGCNDEVTAGCDESAAGRGRREMFEPAHQYRHRQLKSLYERRACSVEAQDEDAQALHSGDQKDYSDSRASCNDSRCSVSTEDDDHSSVVHVVGPSQHNHCSSCMESTHVPVCGCSLLI